MADSNLVSPGTTPALQVAGATVRFGGVIAVNNVNLVVPRNSIAGLIGPNGAGKTTLVNVIAGTIRPNSGDVRMFGNDIKNWKAYRRARNGLSRTFQNLELFGSLTVRENVAFPLDARSTALGSLPASAGSSADEEQVDSALVTLGLWDIQNFLVSDISYAQRKLVEFGRAITGPTRILLLDEPVAGVALEERRPLIDRIAAVIKERQLSVLIIEHDLNVISSLCERVYVMDMGEVLASGTLTEVLADSRVRDAYLGANATASDYH